MEDDLYNSKIKLVPPQQDTNREDQSYLVFQEEALKAWKSIMNNDEGRIQNHERMLQWGSL